MQLAIIEVPHQQDQGDFFVTARNAPSSDSHDVQEQPELALPLTASEDRQWATVAHFGAILGCIPSAIVYALYKSRGPFTAQESKEALNFTLPLTALAIVLNLLTLLPGFGSIFAVAAVVLWVFMTVAGARAAINANRGRPHRYLVNLRLIK